MSHRIGALALALGLVVTAAACSDDSDDEASDTTQSSASGSDDGACAASGTLRLGFFPNVTHAPALVGVEEGTFADALGPDVTLETSTFNTGTTASEALLSGGIDLTYIGPNPAINAFAQSNGEAVRLVAGSTSGGAALVVKPEIDSAEDLAGTTLATPSLGNTQDVALRYWLSEEGYETTPEGGGDVSITPQENATTLESFQQDLIDGAWLPEPWSTRLVQDAGAEVLVDEADLWPEGQFVTTHVLVSTSFLESEPELLSCFLEGHVAALDFTNDNPEDAQADVISQIETITGSSVDPEVIATAFGNLEFTEDPIASSLQGSADHAIEVGLLDPVDLEGIYDLGPLDEVLEADGQAPVSGL